MFFSQLIDMGFDGELAREALSSTSNLEQAMEYILSHPPAAARPARVRLGVFYWMTVENHNQCNYSTNHTGCRKNVQPTRSQSYLRFVLLRIDQSAVRENASLREESHLGFAFV